MTMLYDELPDYDSDYKKNIFDKVKERFKIFDGYNLPYSINKTEFSEEERKFCIKCANELSNLFEHIMLYVFLICQDCRKKSPNAWCDSCPTLEMLQHMDYLESVFGMKTSKYSENLSDEKYESTIMRQNIREMEDF